MRLRPASCPDRSQRRARPVELEPARAASNEPHLENVRQLTFGGENAEAYWSFDGKQLILQAHQGEGCDQDLPAHTG